MKELNIQIENAEVTINYLEKNGVAVAVTGGSWTYREPVPFARMVNLPALLVNPTPCPNMKRDGRQ